MPEKPLDPRVASVSDAGVVLPIKGDAEGSMAEWLRSLVRDQPIHPGVSGAELLAEARTEP